MRKTFKFFCAVAIALLTVSSCGKIWDEFDAVHSEIDALKAKIEALEKDLNAKIATINATLGDLEGQVAVVDVKKEGENYILTFKDGSKLTIAASGTEGFVTTVVGADGNTYWAIIDQNGEPQILDAVVHPDTQLMFSVDPETYEVSVSYDNGKTWIPTGVFVKDDSTINIVTGFQYNEGDDFLTITVGGTQYRLPVYKDDTSSIVPGRAQFFLHYEGVKSVALTATDIAELYVMAKPNGWKASIEDDALVVTAPTKAAVEIGAAETEGEILIHATNADGKCKVAKIEVTTGPGLTLAVDAKGNITIENSYASEQTNMWGETTFGFSDFVFGLASPGEFLADPEAYLEYYNENWNAPIVFDIILPSMYNVAMKGEYVEGEYETDVVKTTVSDVYFSCSYEELPAGAHYVVWVAPADASKEGAAIVEDMVYVEYVNLVHEVEVKSVSYSDITISANVAGASSYVIGCVAESEYNTDWNPSTFEDYMQQPMGGRWTGFKNYGAADALGVVIPASDIPAEFNLSDIIEEKLSFNENYKVWVMPLVDHKAILDEENSFPEEDYYVYDFSAFDFEKDFLPYVIDAKTNDITPGGDYAATLTLNSRDYSTINVDVALSEGTDIVYYAWYSVEDYDMFENDADVMAALFEDCYMPLTEDEMVAKEYRNPGEEFYLATLSIGKDGKYGEVVAKKFSTASVPFDSSVTVEIESCVPTEVDGKIKSYTVTVKVSGGAKVMGYNITNSESSQNTFFSNLCKNGHLASYYGYQFADVEDGKAVLTFDYSSYKKDYLVAAYNVEDGMVSAVSAEVAVEHLFD